MDLLAVCWTNDCAATSMEKLEAASTLFLRFLSRFSPRAVEPRKFTGYKATRKRERERNSCFLRPPSFSPRVLRDSGRIAGGKFTRVRSERKAVSIFRDKLVTVYRNWKLNRGTYGFFSSLVLFFVTFKEDLLRMFASKLWTFSWNFLGKRFKRDFSFFF